MQRRVTTSILFASAVLILVGLFLSCVESKDRVINDVGTGGPGDTGADSDTDTDTDADGDSDGDSDGDADTDTDGDADGDADGDSDGDADGDSDGDADGDSDGDAGDTEVCDEQDFKIEYTPVRLMILQDRSSSMSTATESGLSRWAEAKPALVTMLNDSANDHIEFGFDIFPDNGGSLLGGGCGVDKPVKFDCAPNNHQDIIDYVNSLASNSIDGMTPLCAGMHKFSEANYASSFSATDATSYLLVVSDGLDSCGGPPAVPCNGTNFEKLTSDLLNVNEIKTFIIGFGGGNLDDLNVIAQNGGTGSTEYIPASNQSELQDALDSITSSVVSCMYDIDEPNAQSDPDKVNFYFDDVLVGADEDCQLGKGWTWTDDTHSRVEFCEEACEQLRSGSVEEVSARFGCPTQVVV